MNNYTSEEVLTIKSEINDDTAKFAVIGREVGESGTPHLQGFLHMNKRKRLTGMKKVLGPRAHIEAAKGTDKENDTYCSKGGDTMLRIGEPVNSANKVKFKMVELAKMYNADNNISLKEMEPEWQACWMMHKRRIIEFSERENILEDKKKILKGYDGVEWNAFQKKVLEIIAEKPDRRKIHWFWSATGNVGKSFIAQYIRMKYDALYVEDTCKRDVAFMCNRPKIAIFDMGAHAIGEDGKDWINYRTIESIKNGFICSMKYESHLKWFEVPHVIVFANRLPNYMALMPDRWDVREINEETKDFVFYGE